MKPIRKAALVKATIVEIRRVRVSGRDCQSDCQAGGHVLGACSSLFRFERRYVSGRNAPYSNALRRGSARGAGRSPKGRKGGSGPSCAHSFSPTNFRREAVGAWLNFWVLSQSVPEAKRLLAGRSAASAVEFGRGDPSPCRGSGGGNRRITRRDDRRALPARRCRNPVRRTGPRLRNWPCAI